MSQAQVVNYSKINDHHQCTEGQSLLVSKTMDLQALMGSPAQVCSLLGL